MFSERWLLFSTFPLRRWKKLKTVAFNGKVYLFGGYIYGGINCTDAAESYDPKTDTWTDIASMPTRRSALTAAEAKGKIYVMGGYNDYSKQILDLVEAYNPAKDTWET